MSVSASKEMSDKNIHELEDIFPDAAGVFSARYKKLKDSYKDALIVLDTNVLFLPYSLRKERLENLKNLYTKLIRESRLHIPARVAREFAKNRNKKLAEIHHSLAQLKTGKRKSIASYPIIEGLNERKELDLALNELERAESEFYKKVDSVIKAINSWEWNDPVSSIYSELFNAEVLIDHDLSKDDLFAEVDRRSRLKIPPGYKDSAKDDGGVGDLAIWLSILKHCKASGKDVIFVTEDAKPDWWNQSNGSKFLPRFELIDEYRRTSVGGTIHIIQFSKLLELFEVEEALINETKELEKARRDVDVKFWLDLNKNITKLRNRRSITTSEMKEWFHSNYRDPADCCPYESAEGGYQYIWGGPYYARDVIEEKFSGVATEEMIDEVAEELEALSFEWSGMPGFESEDYD